MNALLTNANPAALEPDDLYNMFEPSFSDEGSNARVEEEAAMFTWMMFLQDCGSNIGKCKLEDVLAFVTGARHRPPCGYGVQPQITFCGASPLPSASTCAVQLVLPTGLGEEEFHDKMTEGILGALGFGSA
ncbi:PREDICTED: uncharacterized protein LOC106819862 [Priapulus caudatus]|uniref:Uncharacterized protein LOC106819862 n=1 Tax=Priapulus caudatus TaxID=37621 RepID=A0ABM1F650_PRICU|nr:PREDICTED: uncharacterized protein LOC106819862 [Priapulus caudatus]